MKKSHCPPQDVLIPIPDEQEAGSIGNEKAGASRDSPASQGTWDTEQTLDEGLPEEEETASERAAASSPHKFPTKTRVCAFPPPQNKGNQANPLGVDTTPEGYPRLACFAASDQNFMIYRSFSYLHARCLLYIQDEVTCLERDLDELDREDDAHGEEEVKLRLKCRGAEDWEEDARGKLVRRIKRKLDEYDDFLLKAKTLVSLQKPSNRDYKSVRTWFGNEEPVVRREQKYIECKEDLVTLRNGRECAGFDGFVEGVVRWLNSRFIRELRVKSTSPTIHYFSPGRLDKLVALLITIIILILLVLPVIALVVLQQHYPEQQQQRPQQPGQAQQAAAFCALMVFRSIGVLMVFTLAFSAVMSMLTKARRHEVFASSAA